MDTQKLHDLIDKVIGKKGPLRVPAYWMWRVLNAIIEVLQKAFSKIGDVTNSVEDVKKSLIEIANNSEELAKVPSMTYEELVQLASHSELNPGKLYLINDYRITTTKVYDVTNDVYFSGSDDTAKSILVRALSSSTLSNEAYLIPGGPCKYVLHRDIYKCHWVPLEGEVDFTALDGSGTEIRYTYVGLSSDNSPKFQRDDGTYVTSNNSINQSINPGDKIILSLENGTYVHSVTVKSVNDPFRGGIYQYTANLHNVTIPCDPSLVWSSNEGTTYSVIRADILYQNVASLYMGSRLVAKRFVFPKVSLTPLYSSNTLYVISGIYHIGENCNNVILSPYMPTTMLVGNNCENIKLYSKAEIKSNCSNITVQYHRIYTRELVQFREYCNNITIPSGARSNFIFKGYNSNISLIVSDSVESVSNTFIFNEGVSDITVYLDSVGVSGKVLNVFKGEDGQAIIIPASSMGEAINTITRSGDGTKFLSDDGIYKPITPATVVDEATGDNLDSMLPFKLVIDDISTPISSENFNKLKAAMLANRPIYIITGGIACIALVTPATEGSRLIATILVPRMDSTVMCIVMAFLPDDVPVILTEPDNPTYMVKAGQGINIEQDGTISCTLDTNPFITGSTLPSEGVVGKIYLIPSTVTGEQNVMVEYIWVNGAWEKLGEFKTDIDLSAYALKTEVPAVVDNLTEGGATKALSAEQGKVLNAEVAQLSQRHLIPDTYTRTDGVEGGKTTQEAFLFRYEAGNALSITLLNIGENTSVNIILNYDDGSNTRLSTVGINSEKVVIPEKDIVSIGYYASKACEITIQIKNNSAISINDLEIEGQKRLGAINADSYEFKSTNLVRSGSSQYKVFPFSHLAGKPLFVKLISPATVTLVATFSDGTTGILKQSLNVSDSEIIIVPDKEIAYLGYYISTTFGSTVEVTLYLRGNYAMIEQINNRIGLLTVVNSQSNLYDASNVITGYEVYTNGKPAVQANSAYIKLAIEDAFGAGLTIKGLPAVSTGLTSRYWSFMDINNNVIKTGVFTQNSDATQYVIIPNNAKYFLLSIYQRVSGDKPNIEDISIIYGVDEQTNSLLLKTENLDVQLKAPKQYSIAIFGDSITETDSITFVSENEPYTTNINYLVRSNWPKFMLLGIDSRLRVSEMRNYANSGASFENHNTGTPRQYLAFQISEMLADLSAPEGGYYYGKGFQPDIVIISCGTNDIADSSTYDSAMSKTVYYTDGSIDVEATLQNLDTENSFSEAVRYAFMKIRSIFPNALCFYCTPIQRKSQETPPQILDAAKALAKRYAFNIVDCNSDSVITRENSSIFLSDGLHPNLDGQKILAKFIVKSIVSSLIE